MILFYQLLVKYLGELVETINEQNLSQDNIFLNAGAMGHVSMISEDC